MKKSSFWSDASRCGAIVGAVNVVTSLLGMLLPSIAFVSGLVNFVATVYLLFYFTRKRANLFIEEGYTYSQSLGFIVASGLFVGVVCAVYQIIASNFLFTEQVEQALQTIIATYSSMGAMDNNTLDSVQEISRMYLFSPIPVLLSNILSHILTFCFYGLFIAIGTKREADIFDSTVDTEDED